MPIATPTIWIFSWKNVVAEARTKEAGLDPVVLYDLMRSFPREMVSTIRWAIEVDPEAFLKDLNRLAEDLFFMGDNLRNCQGSK